MLIALLLPAIKKARFWARVAACGSNMHQLSIGTIAFAEDHHGLLIRHPDLSDVPDPTATPAVLPSGSQREAYPNFVSVRP